jgi:SprT protein
MQLPFLGIKSGLSFGTHTPVAVRIIIPDLSAFIPEAAIGYVTNWFHLNVVQLKISKARSSKFGDYRSSLKNIPARISVNRNLNKFDFLITLVHEMAHHEIWKSIDNQTREFGLQRRKRRPLPHGKEWKNHYRQLMLPLLNETVFPADVIQHLISHFENPRSSSKSNEHLVYALKKYDVPDNAVFIESLPINSVFALPAGRKFKKQEKLRKRYRCICLNNGRTYLFSPMARVLPL